MPYGRYGQSPGLLGGPKRVSRTLKSRREARADDLYMALRSRDGHVRKGNQSIRITQPRLEASFEVCAPCPLNMRCCVQGEVLHVGEIAQFKEDGVINEGAVIPCLVGRNVIRFSYHSSVCLSFDMEKECVTDHGMYGYSQTTSQSIGTYLHALAENGFIVGGDACVEKLKKVFKRLRDGKKIPPEWRYLNDGFEEKVDKGCFWLHVPTVYNDPRLD